MPAPDPPVIIEVIVASIAYATLFYASKAPEGVPFDTTKYGATVIVGAVIGVSLWYAGDPLTEMSMAAQLGMYGAMVASVERVLYILYRSWKRWESGQSNTGNDGVA